MRALGFAIQVLACLIGVIALIALPTLPLMLFLSVSWPDDLPLQLSAWVIVPILVLPAAAALFAWGRRLWNHGLQHSVCWRCGYDLRAATGDYCPECGEALGAA